MYHFHPRKLRRCVAMWGWGIYNFAENVHEKVQHFLCWDILQKDQENKIFMKCTFSWNNVVFLHFMHFISYLTPYTQHNKPNNNKTFSA